MMRISIVVLLAGLISACAGIGVNREVPKAWAQSAQEAGLLPVGRVIEVNRIIYRQGDSSSTGAGAGVAVATGVVGALITPALDGLNHGDWYYRHRIRLRGTGEIVLRDEYASYSVGDCVAIRTSPHLVVPALVGACD